MLRIQAGQEDKEEPFKSPFKLKYPVGDDLFMKL